MADKRLTALTELTAVASDDYVYVVDKSDTTDGPSGTSKYVQAGRLRNDFNVKAFGAVGDGVTDDTSAVQTAISAAVTAGCAVYFPYGTYMVENLAVTTADELVIVGAPGSKPTIKLRDDDSGGGLGQILIITDVVDVVIKNIKFHGNYDNAKAGNINSRLVEIEQSSAAGGVSGYKALIEDVEFEESAQGYGHLKISSYEESGSGYGWYEQITINRFRSLYSGFSGNGIFLRGHIKSAIVTDVFGRNDGQYGFEAKGAASYAGSSSYLLALSAEVAYGRYIENLRVENLYSYRCTGTSFYQMVRNHHTANMVCEEICINPYYDVSAAAITSVDDSTDIITATVPSGYGDSSVVRFTTTGTLPDPLIADAIYYVRDTSGNTFKLADYSGDSAIDITDTGSGTHSIEWLGVTLTTNIKEDDNVYVPEWPGTHTYSNVLCKNNTPHSASRALSVEESSANTSTPLHLIDCSFDDNVSLATAYPDTLYRVTNCNIGVGNDNYTYPNSSGKQGSSLGLLDGAVENSRFYTNVVQVNIHSNLSFRDCLFDKGLTFGYPSSEDYTNLTIDNCVFNVADAGIVYIDQTATTTGTEHVVNINNCRPAPGNTYGLELRILATTTSSLFKYYITNSDIDLASFGEARDAATQIISSNNRGMRRGNTLFPSVTLADSATPSIVGVSTCQTGGTTQITDFTGEIGNEHITVYINTGDQINDGATIVTKAGANIAGPAVRQFVNFSSVWYEV